MRPSVDLTAVEILRRKGDRLLLAPPEPIKFTGIEAPDALLNDLDVHPHAFVIACIMDRQMKAEKAWAIPYEIRQALGDFSFSKLKKLTLDDAVNVFTKPKKLHRYSEDMAKNFFLAIGRIDKVYSGNAANIWNDTPSSARLVRRFLEFRGVGPKIGTMAANMLARDFKIPVTDRISIDISPDVHVMRVFRRLGLLDENASNEELIYLARELNPQYPGIFDLSVWEIGRNWCKPTNPLCQDCELSDSCPSATKGTKGLG
jgi:endonuclease III